MLSRLLPSLLAVLPAVAWGQAAPFDLRGPDLYAVAAPPGASVSYNAKNITSPLSVLYDPAAGDSNTYVRYGTESWKSLTSAANIKLPGGVYGTDIMPVDSAGVCRTSNIYN